MCIIKLELQTTRNETEEGKVIKENNIATKLYSN